MWLTIGTKGTEWGKTESPERAEYLCEEHSSKLYLVRFQNPFGIGDMQVSLCHG